jgi:hypothetical protein
MLVGLEANSPLPMVPQNPRLNLSHALGNLSDLNYYRAEGTELPDGTSVYYPCLTSMRNPTMKIRRKQLNVAYSETVHRHITILPLRSDSSQPEVEFECFLPMIRF